MDGDCDLMELVFCPSPPLLQFAAVGAGIESKVLSKGVTVAAAASQSLNSFRAGRISPFW